MTRHLRFFWILAAGLLLIACTDPAPTPPPVADEATPTETEATAAPTATEAPPTEPPSRENVSDRPQIS